MSTLANSSCPSFSPMTESNFGVNALQGAHHLKRNQILQSKVPSRKSPIFMKLRFACFEHEKDDYFLEKFSGLNPFMTLPS